MENIIRVEWNNQPVLTNAQIAEKLECPIDQLKWIYARHKEQFQEGVHFFKVEGDALRTLKKEVANRYLDSSSIEKEVASSNSDSSLSALTFGKGAKCLKLWTCQGVARLSKLIDTPKAWELFTVLEQNYFNPAPVEVKEEVKEEPKKKRKPRSEKACAYAMKMSNKLVKIGHTGDLADRISRVENESGWQVTDEHHSPDLERSDASRIERTLHRKYAHVKVKGEFFNADFDDVSDQLDREVELIEETICLPAELTDYDRVRLAIDLIGVSPENCRERLVHAAANLLFGKDF